MLQPPFLQEYSLNLSAYQQRMLRVLSICSQASQISDQNKAAIQQKSFAGLSKPSIFQLCRTAFLVAWHSLLSLQSCQ